MKGFGKSCCAILCAFMLVCLLAIGVRAESVKSCPGDCSHEASIGIVHYDTFAEAINAAKADETITLLTDVVIDSPVIVKQPLVLDLGSRTLTAQLAEDTQSALWFLRDSTLRNGTVTVSTGSAVMVSDCEVALEKDLTLESTAAAPVVRVTAGQEKTAIVRAACRIQSKEAPSLIDVSSEDGTCELYILKDAQLITEENPAIIFNSAGKLSIEDGSIRTKKDAICVILLKDRDTEVSIIGGEILSEEGQVIVFDLEEDTQAPENFITGGTFDPIPEDYIPDYSQIIENEDGTASIISAYYLSFQANGGNGTMEPLKIPCGSAVNMPANAFTAPSGKDFAGWEIDGELYAPGDAFTPTGDASAKALWKKHQHTGGYATCMEKAVCDACGKTYGNYGSHHLVYSGGYAPTCTDTGMNDHSKCTTCGGCFVDGIRISASALTIAAPGHDWEDAEAQPATCETDGVKAYRKCRTCGELQIDGITAQEEDLLIPSPGHMLEEIAATQATCKDAGIQAHSHCSVCDGLFLNGQPADMQALTIALSAHVLSDWQQDELYHWKACVDCGEVFRQNSHMDMDLSGSCDDCGWEMPVAQVEAPQEEDPAFSWLFLIPVIAAVAIAVPLSVKKFKQ